LSSELDILKSRLTLLSSQQFVLDNRDNDVDILNALEPSNNGAQSWYKDPSIKWNRVPLGQLPGGGVINLELPLKIDDPTFALQAGIMCELRSLPRSAQEETATPPSPKLVVQEKSSGENKIKVF
jgi:hypothetical protein